MIHKTCPICSREEILPPNGVCRICYEHLKEDEVPSREKMTAGVRKRFRENYPNAAQETVEKNIESAMKFHQEKWDSMTKGGLKAVQLAAIVVDDAKHLPTWKAWHRRRIAFVSDLIAFLPDALFAPATRAQLNRYTRTAVDYWDGKLSEESREQIYREFEIQIDKKTNPSTWDEKSLPLWMMQTRDFFDWMWEQFMDCVYECVPVEFDLTDSDWMCLYHRHFSDVLEQWILRE